MLRKTICQIVLIPFYRFSAQVSPTMDSRLKECSNVMDGVYGPFSPSWSPAPFEESKSRYLWTDAFGVCNYLTLYKRTDEEHYMKQAKILIDTVHDTLGRSRKGRQRLGKATEDHPTLGGLRIGKPEDEGPGMSEDGQYFHYLTKWMFALNRASLALDYPKYNQWAVELVQSVHFKFCTPDKSRMIWKMSIDLQRPLARSEGGLDTFDGLTMYLILQETAKRFDGYENLDTQQKKKWDETHLKPEIDHMKLLVMSRMERYSTHDALDAGEALWLAHFYPEMDYAKVLKQRAGITVEKLWKLGEFHGPPSHRLAFREFGTTIGVQMHHDLDCLWKDRVEELHKFWRPHLSLRDNDITPVMYCSSLVPGVMNKAFLWSLH